MKQFTLKRTLNTLTLAVSIALLTACGGGSDGNISIGEQNNNGNQNDSGGQNGDGGQSQKLEVDESYENANYELKNNIIQIGSYYLNQYDDINTRLLNHKSSNQRDEFNQLLDQYIDELLLVTKPVDEIPSYAPRGELKSKLIKVVNGKLDYSDYVLTGDFNNDGIIDTADLEDFKQALYEQDPALLSKYDVNGDGVLDSRDLIEVTSQLLTDISYYDFYSSSGQKLNIATRKYSDDKVIDYNGSETQILVVAKDINKASSFTDSDSIKLSDLAEVWYKNTEQQVGVASATIAQPRLLASPMLASGASANANAPLEFDFTNNQQQRKQKFIQAMTDYMLDSATMDEKYLIGFAFSAKLSNMVGGFGDDSVSLSGNMATLNTIKQTMKQHFPTDLGRPFKENTIGQPQRFVYHIGQVGGDVKGGVPQPTKAKHSATKAVRRTIKLTRKIGKQTVIQTMIFHASGVSYLSKKEERLSAKVLDPAGGKVKGTLSANRYGPLPATLTNNQEGSGDYRFNSLPWGGYNFEFKNECGCPLSIDPKQKDFIEANEEVTFNISEMQKDIKVKLNYKDKQGKPIKNKLVTVQETARCRSKGHVPGTMKRKTDDNGVVNFVGNFTSGEFIIDGKTYNLCTDTDKDMNAKNLWDIKIDYDASGTVFGEFGSNGSVHKTIKDVEIASIEDNINPMGNSEETSPVPFNFSIEQFHTTYLSVKSQFALIYTNGGGRLTEVDEDGVDITTILDPNKYCIGVTADDEPPFFERCVAFETSLSAMDTSNKLQAYLNAGQVEKLKNHEAFTYSGSGSWGDGKVAQMEETLVVEFIPK